MMTQDQALNKVRALVRKAECASVSDQESAAFSAKAGKLMTRYGIDQRSPAVWADMPNQELF
jgi:hypothetical protein